MIKDLLDSKSAVKITIFLLGHFFSAGVAFAGALIVYSFIPKDFPILDVLGKRWFCILATLILFLLIEGIIWIFRKIRKIIKEKKTEELAIEEELHNLWNITSCFSPKDKHLLKDFITSGNKAIIKPATSYYAQTALLGSGLVDNTEVISQNNSVVDINNGFIYSSTCGLDRSYKLKDNVYTLLKYGYDKYGKISNFD